MQKLILSTGLLVILLGYTFSAVALMKCGKYMNNM